MNMNMNMKTNINKKQDEMGNATLLYFVFAYCSSPVHFSIYLSIYLQPATELVLVDGIDEVLKGLLGGSGGNTLPGDLDPFLPVLGHAGDDRESG